MKPNTEGTQIENVDAIFNDFESKHNLVSLYSLLLEIDKRVSPQLYTDSAGSGEHD